MRLDKRSWGVFAPGRDGTRDGLLLCLEAFRHDCDLTLYENPVSRFQVGCRSNRAVEQFALTDSRIRLVVLPVLFLPYMKVLRVPETCRVNVVQPARDEWTPVGCGQLPALEVPGQREESGWVGLRVRCAGRAAASGCPDARIRRAYQLLFSRQPDSDELATGSEYLGTDTWERYCWVLLASSEFLTVR